MNVRFDGRDLQVVFEGRTNRPMPRSSRNKPLQDRLKHALERVAPDVAAYDVVVSPWLPGDHPPEHQGGYCQYSNRTLFIEEMDDPEDPVIWNCLIETALHELAHLIYGPATESHGQGWLQIFAQLLAVAHQIEVYDYQLAGQHDMAGSEAYRPELMAQVEALVSRHHSSDQH